MSNELSPYEWTYHAFHLHGYEFFVQELGFPRLDQHGNIIGLDDALSCTGGTRCPKVEYREDILKKRRVHNLNTVAKNTILVPAMGYAIVRFKATNPGIWPMHCHQLFHNSQGMAVALNVEDKEENKPFSYLPEDFPRCADYDPTSYSTPKKASQNHFLHFITHHILFSSSILVVFLSLVFIFVKCCFLPRFKNGYEYAPLNGGEKGIRLYTKKLQEFVNQRITNRQKSESRNEDREPLISNDECQDSNKMEDDTDQEIIDSPTYNPEEDNDDEDFACEHKDNFPNGHWDNDDSKFSLFKPDQ
ncbi:Oidioi.mRNA.OKI2018_I69.PAR.g8463.t1.cds [Oikopleura dioica]|nr:Oidioi.mRNA.OKI2018_I69.PAR.g8463.t1.cds [Oikopleura dioica]